MLNVNTVLMNEMVKNLKFPLRKYMVIIIVLGRRRKKEPWDTSQPT